MSMCSATKYLINVKILCDSNKQWSVNKSKIYQQDKPKHQLTVTDKRPPSGGKKKPKQNSTGSYLVAWIQASIRISWTTTNWGCGLSNELSHFNPPTRITVGKKKEKKTVSLFWHQLFSFSLFFKLYFFFCKTKRFKYLTQQIEKNYSSFVSPIIWIIL